MRSIWTKAIAAIGMLLSLVCAGYLIGMGLYYIAPALLDDGTSIYNPVYEAWMCSLSALVISVFSLIFYAIDAVICLVKAIMRIDTVFNVVLALILVGGVCFGVFVLCSYLRTAKTIAWFSYYFVLFSFEIVSIVRCIKRQAKETVADLNIEMNKIA